MKIITASATVSINAIAAQKKRNGEQVYNFAAGDPVLSNHPSIIKQAIQQTEKKFCPYPPVEGIPELRSLAAEWVNITCSTKYTKDNVLVTCGGKFGIFASIYALLQADEEVLIPAPYWVSYPEIVKMAGGTPKIVHSTAANGWKVTPQDILKQMTKNSRMIILNNACNPTGVVYTKQEISDILALAEKFKLIVISDEVYSGLVYEKESYISCGSFSEHRERVIVIQSCSKNFGMTGWRIGFVLGPEEVIKRLTLLQSQTTTGVSVISQWGAVGALENHIEVNTYVKVAMRKRRDLFVTTYNSLFPTPLEKIESALYAFVPISSMIENISDSVLFSEKLIASNIAVVPGIAFGVDGYVRFAFSETEDNIMQGLLELRRAITRISGEST